jgi:hypothetical protein
MKDDGKWGHWKKGAVFMSFFFKFPSHLDEGTMIYSFYVQSDSGGWRGQRVCVLSKDGDSRGKHR